MAEHIGTAKVTPLIMGQWFRRLIPVATNSNKWDAIAEEAWNEGDHRLPYDPQQWVIYPERMLVKPMILSGKIKYPLIQEMISSPGTIYLVSDAQASGPFSLTLCVAGFSDTELEDWLRKQRPRKMVLGECQGHLLLAAPLITFTQ